MEPLACFVLRTEAVKEMLKVTIAYPVWLTGGENAWLIIVFDVIILCDSPQSLTKTQPVLFHVNQKLL